MHLLKPGLLASALTCMLVILTAGIARTQTVDQPCGTRNIHNDKLQTDSVYRRMVRRVDERTFDKAGMDMTTNHVIPVMFVVYHLGEPVGSGTNVSEADIQAQLTQLNNRFAGVGATPAGTNARLQFTLAQRTPACQSFGGIVRVNASAVPDYASTGIVYGDFTVENQLRKLTPAYSSGTADSRQFITIHLVNKMIGASAYASFGGDIVCDYRQMGALTHEMGHVFFLYHTFEGSETDTPGVFVCPPNANPEKDGDRVTDTAPHKLDDQCQGGGNDTHLNTCTGQPFGSILYNFMSYSCGNRFTLGQLTRMRTALYTVMPGLIGSPYLTPPQPQEVLRPVSCSIATGQPTGQYTTGLSRVRFGNLDHSSGEAPLHEGHYTDFSCTRKTIVTAGATYSLITNSRSVNRRAYLDYNNDGVFDENTERIHTGASNGNFGVEEVRGLVTIPVTAVQHTYLRLRVVADPGTSLPTACLLPGHAAYGPGEVEDYGVMILPDNLPVSLSITAWPTRMFCTGKAVTIPVATSGVFGPANRFRVLLSDAAGSFAASTTLAETTILPLSATIPDNLNLDGTYRIRIVSTSPALVSNDSPVLMLEPSPTATLTGSQTITAGQRVTLTATITGREPWKVYLYGSDFSSVFLYDLYSTPVSLTVAPTVTTVYTLSVSNEVCGIVSAAHTVTVTVPCPTPLNLAEVNKTLTSVQLDWNRIYGNTYDIQWKPVSASTWTQISRLYVQPTLTDLAYGQTYQWQIRTNCPDGQTSAWSPVRTFTMDCAVPFDLRELTVPTQADLLWGSPGGLVTYDLQWRRQGEATWQTQPALTLNSLRLTGLTAGGVYEWQVQSRCPDNSQSAYSAPRTFTAQCGMPVNLTMLAASSTGARVGWTGLAGLTYQVRWRLNMTTTWTEAPASTTNTYYDITGLGNNLSYQWQVRTVCSPTESSAYTNSDYIYTTCSAPAILTWTVLSPTSVRLEWSEAGPDVSYELRWRPYGAAGWTTVAALTGAAYSLTGLTTNVFYEWQLRTVCAGGQSSEFSYSRYFRPVSCTAMTTLKAGSWLDPAVWSCNRIPVSTDAVVVAHPVTVPVNATATIRKLSYGTGGKVSLATGSRLVLQP